MLMLRLGNDVTRGWSSKPRSRSRSMMPFFKASEVVISVSGPHLRLHLHTSPNLKREWSERAERAPQRQAEPTASLPR